MVGLHTNAETEAIAQAKRQIEDENAKRLLGADGLGSKFLQDFVARGYRAGSAR